MENQIYRNLGIIGEWASQARKYARQSGGVSNNS